MNIKSKLTLAFSIPILFSLVGMLIYRNYLFSHYLPKGIDIDQKGDDLGLFLSFVAITILSTAIGYFLSNLVSASLTQLEALIQSMTEGKLPEIHIGNKKDEFASIKKSLQELIKGQKKVAEFAHEIGEGNLKAEYELLSEQDQMGKALLHMRSSLLEAELKDLERNRMSIVSSKVGEIVRSHHSLSDMGEQLLPYLCKEMSCVQGAFYICETLNESAKPLIVLQKSFAYSRKKYLQGTYKFGEGLVGQACIEKDYVLRTEIPSDYVTISSGILGDKKPGSILIVPLIANEIVYGALEFASIKRFTTEDIGLLQNIALILAQTIFNVQVNEKTAKLLEASQQMSSELQEQSEMLRQNAEEMQSTQEELIHTNAKLEDQIGEVKRTQKRTHILLENASEVIMICSEDMLIQYVSPSVEHILGYKPMELLKSKDLERIHTLGQEDYNGMFATLIRNPKENVTIEYSYLKKNGEKIWLEVTGKNMTSDSAISGFVLNIRDITERRRAEQESRMRSQMQSLSENSPDLICRINKEGTIYYVNPTITHLTDYTPDVFLRQNIENIPLVDSIKHTWQNLIDRVVDEKSKIQVEMEFPSKLGSLMMSVNAIPEFTEDAHLESVLLVSNDITDRKKQEVEISQKNKKITESINYAQRIQSAILPDLQKVKNSFPGFFMYYKPRDVVSGDFPWFVEEGDYVYMAAVDCTGHGVPGAMLSLIGYFLLNDIVKSRHIHEPSKILDLLDEGVTKTLKQDEEGSEMKDGMDIALLCYHKSSGTVSYSGAHRPLYLLRNGEIIEWKGNKFPIGGGTFKNQTLFTHYEEKVQKNDSLFFFSDGYPDQFGGDENRKFGPARIRNIILENKTLKDFTAYETLFGDAFENWKGNGKQTDDVLLIGIKF